MQNEKIVRSQTSLNISNKDSLSNTDLNSVTLKPDLSSPENTQDQNIKVRKRNLSGFGRGKITEKVSNNSSKNTDSLQVIKDSEKTVSSSALFY